MKREIHLYGSLAKITDKSVYTLDCDDQKMLFASLRSLSPKMNYALRKVEQVKIIGTNKEKNKVEGLDSDFTFGDTVEEIHIVPDTTGDAQAAIAAFSITNPWAEVAIYVAVAVATAYITAALTMHLSPGNNGAGGAKSTMFNGPINSTDQGGPIPIIYGTKVLTGSTIIAADVTYINVA